jgi:AcrR family transcriptional regulator
MPSHRFPQLSSRKDPQQARSNRLVADILEAAAHVLARDGAHRFTTGRVAERAGVSVGSLYQYFPNKEAILFRLQVEEWKETGGMLQDILADRSRPPAERLRAVVRAFFRSEVVEAPLRVALSDAVPLYRDAPEVRQHGQDAKRRVMTFMREVMPGVRLAQRQRAAEIITMAMETVGKKISEQGRSPAAVDDFAAATGDMLCAYLDKLVAEAANKKRHSRKREIRQASSELRREA